MLEVDSSEAWLWVASAPAAGSTDILWPADSEAAPESDSKHRSGSKDHFPSLLVIAGHSSWSCWSRFSSPLITNHHFETVRGPPRLDLNLRLTARPDLMLVCA